MEDHRNWTDAGWKTYCTPLRLPSPRRYEPGDVVRQSVKITASVETDAVVPVPTHELAVEVADEIVGTLPELGFGASLLPPSASAIDIVRQLRLSHIHVDLWTTGRWAQDLALAVAGAIVLDTHLDEP